MNRDSIIQNVLVKLSKKESMSLDQANEVLFKSFIDKEEIVKPNYTKQKMISNEEHGLLRNLYDNAPVKKLYTYSLGRFGFIIEKLRFDVEPASVQIKKMK